MVVHYYHQNHGNICITDEGYVRPVPINNIAIKQYDQRNQEEIILDTNSKTETQNLVSSVFTEDVGNVRFIAVSDSHQDKSIDYRRTVLFEQIVDCANELSCDFIMHCGDIMNGDTSTLSAPEWKMVCYKQEKS